MNISAISSYNYTSFGAKKTAGKYANETKSKYTKEAKGKYANETFKPTISEKDKRIIATGLIGLTTLGASVATIKSCDPKAIAPATDPSAYIETMEITPTYGDFEIVEPEETKPTQITMEITPISVIPYEDRARVKHHTIRPKDQLVDIVIEYAELDENTPYEKLLPYIERLRIENPSLIKKQDRFNKDGTPGLPEYILLYIETNNKLRVDGIFEENIVNEPIEEPIDETKPEPEPTKPGRKTSPEDTVIINGIEYQFDLGTMKNTMFGDYNGLIEDKYVALDTKIGGKLIETRYAGSTSDSNKIEVIAYDKNGKIEVRDIYDENNNIIEKRTYEYGMDERTETIQYANTKSGQISKEEVVYSLGDSFVMSKQFFAGSSSTATFDFDNDIVTIGENEPWILDEATLIYDANAIGSEKYYGTINGQKVRFDVLKNGYCVEYLDPYGSIASRQQFDAKGNLIYTEQR